MRRTKNTMQKSKPAAMRTANRNSQPSFASTRLSRSRRWEKEEVRSKESLERERRKKVCGVSVCSRVGNCKVAPAPPMIIPLIKFVRSVTKEEDCRVAKKERLRRDWRSMWTLKPQSGLFSNPNLWHAGVSHVANVMRGRNFDLKHTTTQ